ncbi:MAG: hypothetical protein OXN17_18945 [Candidatus Poribacteria bacterium]|nr:hypothetical protein [Candidatus Poribacteria bacterium]
MKIYLLPLFVLLSAHVHAEWELILEKGAHCIASDGERLYAGTEKGIHYSRDDGDTWRLSDFTDRIAHLAASPRLAFAYSAEHGILRSITKGNTWHRKNNGFDRKMDGNRSYYPNLRHFLITSFGMVVAVGHQSGTWMSRNRGDRWQKASDVWKGVPLGNSIYSMGEHDGDLWGLWSIYKAFRSPDEGATWEYIPHWGDVRHIGQFALVEAWVSYRGDLYVGGRRGFGRWREETLDWEDLSQGLPKRPHLYHLVVHRDRIVGGSPYGVFTFDHHSETWYPAGLSDKNILGLVSHRGNLYAAGTTQGHSGVYRAKRPFVSPEDKTAVTWGAIKLGNTK